MPPRAPLLALLAALACTPRPRPTAEPPVPPTSQPEPTPTPTVQPEPTPEPTPTPPSAPEPGTVPLEPEPPVPRDSSGRVPVVRREPVTVGPSDSPALIQRVLRRADFSRCGAARPPPATYSFTIAADGAVIHADALDASGQPSTDAAHACALEVLRGLKFPAGVGTLNVRYPLR